jgi:hypothetical protein
MSDPADPPSPLTEPELDEIRRRDQQASPHPATWAVEDRRRLLATLDAARAPDAGLRTALRKIAVRMVRLEGGCESSHRRGEWHMHEEPYHRIGRELAALASSPAPAGRRLGFIDSDPNRPLDDGRDWPVAPPAPAGLDGRERLANLLAENGIAVENVASIGNADQWLPDYELTDRLIAAGVTLRAATQPAEDADHE